MNCFHENKFVPFTHFFFKFFHYINYNYWFSGIYDTLLMINTSMGQLCYILCFPDYTSNIHGIIAVNGIYPSNTPSMIFRIVWYLFIIWVLINGSSITFDIGLHVIRIRILINNILLIVNHYKLLYFYLIKYLFLHIIVKMFNLLNIRMLHCRCIDNGGVKLSVNFSVDLGSSSCKMIWTLFVGGLNLLL